MLLEFVSPPPPAQGEAPPADSSPPAAAAAAAAAGGGGGGGGAGAGAGAGVHDAAAHVLLAALAVPTAFHLALVQARMLKHAEAC